MSSIILASERNWKSRKDERRKEREDMKKENFILCTVTLVGGRYLYARHYNIVYPLHHYICGIMSKIAFFAM